MKAIGIIPLMVMLSGLTGGERVVLDGPADLKDGDEVQIEEAGS